MCHNQLPSEMVEMFVLRIWTVYQLYLLTSQGECANCCVICCASFFSFMVDPCNLCCLSYYLALSPVLCTILHVSGQMQLLTISVPWATYGPTIIASMTLLEQVDGGGVMTLASIYCTACSSVICECDIVRGNITSSVQNALCLRSGATFNLFSVMGKLWQPIIMMVKL